MLNSLAPLIPSSQLRRIASYRHSFPSLVPVRCTLHFYQTSGYRSHHHGFCCQPRCCVLKVRDHLAGSEVHGIPVICCERRIGHRRHVGIPVCQASATDVVYWWTVTYQSRPCWPRSKSYTGIKATQSRDSNACRLSRMDIYATDWFRRNCAAGTQYYLHELSASLFMLSVTRLYAAKPVR